MKNVFITNLRCENLNNPVGIDTISPRMSWEIESDGRNVRHLAYQIIAASSIHILENDGADLWDTGKVESDRSVHIYYAGRKLESMDQVFWKVRIWDQDNQASAWSPYASWKMGLLSHEEWGGKWIGLEGEVEYKCLRNTNWIVYPGDRTNRISEPVKRYYRRRITIPKDREVDRIYFFYTGDNGCDAWINGRGLGPRFDHNRIRDYDLTYRVEEDDNILALAGFAPGKATNSGAVTALLEIHFKDRSKLLIPTDDKWKVSDKEAKGWNEPGFDDSSWEPAFNIGPVGPAPWGEVRIGENRGLPARYLRKNFNIDKKVRQATVFYSGLGWSELYLNDIKIGDEVLSPGLSEYPKRILYVSHDITGTLNEGKNTVGVILGNGRFFAPRSVVYASMPSYGFPKLRMHMRIEYTDNTVDTIVSDDSWKITTDGPIVCNNHFDGEEYDARKELTGWTSHSYDDTSWQQAGAAKVPEGILSSQMIEPIRVTDTLKPISIAEPKPGVFIFDLGQNITGWCRLKVSGPAGTVVTLRHAETLLPDGNLSLANLRSAKATDIYTLKGQSAEIWEPRFTSHGFRYVELTGFPGKPDINTIEGRMVNDDIGTAGTFSCSNSLLNQILKNITWGLRGNYKTIPMDCPQRDERQGWLGDRAEVMRGESFLFDVMPLYEKWLRDIRDAQLENGSINDRAPTYWPDRKDDVSWPSATLIMINALLLQYGDKEAVKANYTCVKKWMNYMNQYVKDGIIDLDKWGDWCVPPEKEHLIHTEDPGRITSKAVIATSFFYHDAKLMEQFAHLLGYSQDVKHFNALAEELKAAFNKAFYNKDLAQYDNGTQTSFILPLAFNMVPEDQCQRVFDNLVKNIVEKSNSHIGCGLIGMKYLFRVLSDHGRADLAYTMATQPDYPGYGYMISKNATTIWELWNGDTADAFMNSGNHVMLIGDLVIWMYENLAGIKPDTALPGFKHLIMKPCLIPDLQYVNASYHSIIGKISSTWKKSTDLFEWNIELPPDCTADVFIPANELDQIFENNTPIINMKNIQFKRAENGHMIFALGSGSYRFKVIYV